MNYNLIDAREIEKSLLWLSKYWDRPVQPEYYRARTINEAVSLLDKHKEKAKIIAGGIDLLGLMKNRVSLPEVLINVKDIPEMKHITNISGGIDIGALALINDMEKSALIKQKYPALFQAACLTASPQVRNMATIAGNLCQEVRCWYYRRSPETGISFNCRRKIKDGICYAINGENQYHAVIDWKECCAVCPSDMAIVLMALDARIKTVDTDGGRVIPIDQFYTAFGTILDPDEIITAIQVPETSPGAKQRFLKFRLRKTTDFAIVSAAVAITLVDDIIKDARIALGGVSPKPYRAVEAEELLKGKPLTQDIAEKAARASVSNAIPLSKNSYKVSIAGIMVKRALLG